MKSIWRSSVALEQNKGRRPHSHSGNKESNHSSSAEVKNASEIKKRESAPLSEKEQDLKAQIARGKRLQEDRPTGREQGKEDLSFLDKKLSQEGKREKNVDFYTLPKERNEEKRKSSLDILQVNSPDQIEEELEEYYDEKNKKKIFSISASCNSLSPLYKMLRNISIFLSFTAWINSLIEIFEAIIFALET